MTKISGLADAGGKATQIDFKSEFLINLTSHPVNAWHVI